MWKIGKGRGKRKGNKRNKEKSQGYVVVMEGRSVKISKNFIGNPLQSHNSQSPACLRQGLTSVEWYGQFNLKFTSFPDSRILATADCISVRILTPFGIYVVVEKLVWKVKEGGK